MYIYIYVPENRIYYNLVAADSGYEGYSKDHYYHSKDATMDNARLKQRRLFCGCAPCMKLFPGSSLTLANSARAAGTSPKGTFVLIKPKRPDAEFAKNRRIGKPIKEVSDGLLVGRNVTIRIHPSERRDNPSYE